MKKKRMLMVCSALCLLLASCAPQTDSSAETAPDAVLETGEDTVSDAGTESASETASDMEPVEPQQNLTGGDYQYTINEDEETVTIVKYTGTEEAVIIPAEIDGYPVTEIGPQAFRHRELKSLSFPEGIRCIGRQAFEYCVISDYLQLPENTEILEDAFSYAELPAVVTIPAGVTVGKCAFSYCEITERLCIDPDAEIKSRGFSYCRDLELVVCADGSCLQSRAFEVCRSLKTVFLCGDVERKEDAFTGCGEPEMKEAEKGEYDALKQAALDGSLHTEEPVPPEDEVIGLEILGSPASKDGVTVTLEKAEAKRNGGRGYIYSFRGTIENNSDEGLMQVIYGFALIDGNGEEYRSFAEVYDGEDTAIPPHTTIEFSHDDIKWGPQSVPASVKIGVSTVKTENELPPVRMPEKGDYLYQALNNEKLANIKEEPPVELSFHVDEGGYGRTAVFREGAGLRKAVELLCGIQIGEETEEWVTDNYNWIMLTWEDGSYTVISLNLYNLEISVHSRPHMYSLNHLDAFWKYCESYLEEDQ